MCRFYYRVGDGTTWSTIYSFTTFVDVSQGEPFIPLAFQLQLEKSSVSLGFFPSLALHITLLEE